MKTLSVSHLLGIKYLQLEDLHLIFDFKAIKMSEEKETTSAPQDEYGEYEVEMIFVDHII